MQVSRRAEVLEATQIVVACVVSAILYGIVHDEVTAHICVEYFTVAHPHIFPTTSPLVLGIAWGVAGTWWVALLLGSILAYVATRGDATKVKARIVLSRVLLIFIVAALCAALSGTSVYYFALSNRLVLPDGAVPVDKHAAFFAVWAAHLASYFVCITGGLIAILNTWHIRSRQRNLSKPSSEIAATRASPEI